MANPNIDILPKPEFDKLSALRKQIDDSNILTPEADGFRTALEKGTKDEILGSLRTLAASLEKQGVLDTFRTSLKAAQLAVGDTLDDAATVTESLLGNTKDAATEGAKALGKIPGVSNVVDAAKPTFDARVKPVLNATAKPVIDAGMTAYSTLPTAFRLPILGAAVAGTSYLASYPVKWLAKLLGLVSKDARETLIGISDTMKSAGVRRLAIKGGIFAGIAKLATDAFKGGKLDGLIPNRLKKKSAKDGLSPTEAYDS